MASIKGYAAQKVKSLLTPFSFSRREVGANDVLIEIAYCGVCHSDIHQVRDEWGGSMFPMVPGHEIAGKIAKVGANVSRFKVGEAVGVGCFVDSCRDCAACHAGIEQFCEQHTVFTYNSTEKDLVTPTYGGYSTQIVVDENYVLKIPENIPLAQAAPLLCAGITTYSPLKTWKLMPGQKLAVMGLGGLGHMAVKLGVAMQADVTVISSSRHKEESAKQLGAHHFISSNESDELQKHAEMFDLIINTISAPIALEPYLNTLKRDGTMVLVGLPEKAVNINVAPLITKRRRLVGSLIGGIKETQEMLDFCGKHGIGAEIELINIDHINEAYERVIKADVRYRFVIDINSLRK